MVAMEKNPNTKAESPEKIKANMFLNFNWRIIETTETIATINKMIANTK